MQLTKSPIELANSLSVLAASGGPGAAPVIVRNNLPNIACFTDEHTGLSLTWAAHGDPHGGDVKEVSPTILSNPQFREQALRGIFDIDQDTSVLQSALNAQRAHWDGRQLAAANASVEIAKSQAAVIASGQSCIAPRGRELCGSYSVVMGSDEDAATKPPLCPEHIHLAPEYSPVETGRVVNNQSEIVWKRAPRA